MWDSPALQGTPTADDRRPLTQPIPLITRRACHLIGLGRAGVGIRLPGMHDRVRDLRYGSDAHGSIRGCDVRGGLHDRPIRCTYSTAGVAGCAIGVGCAGGVAAVAVPMFCNSA